MREDLTLSVFRKPASSYEMLVGHPAECAFVLAPSLPAHKLALTAVFVGCDLTWYVVRPLCRYRAGRGHAGALPTDSWRLLVPDP